MNLKHPESISIELLSDTTFGAGRGTASGVDVRVNHDSLGLPIVSGKTLHGLLKDSWLKIAERFPNLATNAKRVLGFEGDLDETAILRMGDARVAEDVRKWVDYALNRKTHPVTKQEIEDSLMAVRIQTAVDRESGSYKEGTLRTVQVALRGLNLISPLYWLQEPKEKDVRVLAMSLLLTRHGGLARTRGRGYIKMTFNGDYERTLEIAQGGGR